MRVIPNILRVFAGKFPKNYVNDVADWGFPREELQANKGKLLTMDIDFTNGEQCSLNCPHCYSHNSIIDRNNSPPLSFEEIIDIIEQGKELGLRSIKLLGRGEHTENPRLLDFVEILRKLEITPLLFTKGHVMGDDNMVVNYHSHKGIKTSESFIARLVELNVRILLGFRSFNTKVEDIGVGNISGYSEKRNRALELLCKHGYNQHNPTHIGLMSIPVTRETLQDAFDIYTWGKERNMYVCVAPSMVSGRGSKQTEKYPSPEELIDLYVKIYLWNLERGVQTLEQLKTEGISAYAGSRPCQQIGCGVYVTLFGDVYICPGDDNSSGRFGNIRNDPLKNIWVNSPNFQRSGKFNCYCPPKDGKNIPVGFYATVLKRVEEIVIS